ncbi:MAG: phosphoribosylanthranilate isomerase [Chloroflexi bacterium]|nr:phosphoribosylanthranilate isomerase [Chloroflexota bacterium]
MRVEEIAARTHPRIRATRTRVKICGIQEVEHGLAALEAGADFLGFVFYPPSHRSLTIPRAAELVAAIRRERPNGWQAVGIFVNETPARLDEIAAAVSLDLVQLCGTESPDLCRQVRTPIVKVVRIDDEGRPDGPASAEAWHAARLLLDTASATHWGGTGHSFPWRAVRAIASQAILAGGLRPETVAEAVAQARPWAVDVSSGVERDKRKDAALIRRFVEEVHRAG